MGGASTALATLAHGDRALHISVAGGGGRWGLSRPRHQPFTTFRSPMGKEYCRAVALGWLEGVGGASPANATLAHGDQALQPSGAQ